ncbi:MAG: hypothetical protein ABJ320_18955 [Lentilitoribacter sp.]|uniref:hypothetical protein n=1 Tax=Tateyamaria sp. TaxID=1929288 RepID=UPI00328B2D7B
MPRFLPQRLIPTLALLVLAQPLAAEWQYIEKYSDPIQGFDTRAASTTNADGYGLHLYRNPIGRVYALITLPDSSPDLVRTGPVATVTPMGFDSKEIQAQSERGRVVEYAISTGRALRDRLWHGEGQAPAFGTFHDVLEAPSLVVSLMFENGGTDQTEWSMEGAETAIAKALGISMNGVPAGSEWEDEAAQALLAAMTACQFPKLDVECVQKVSTCSAKISEDRDIDGFDICVAAE